MGVLLTEVIKRAEKTRCGSCCWRWQEERDIIPLDEWAAIRIHTRREFTKSAAADAV